LEFPTKKQGDGITFTLTNWETNSATSVGGDFQLSELMGYAGDSRLDAAGNTFLASNEDDRGLEPPKIAVEFDTRTSSRIDDPPPDYCIDANTINDLTRNDPLDDGTAVADNRDVVQYIFWGRTSFLNIPCRTNPAPLPPSGPPGPPSYDDNRHDADGEEPTEEWSFATGGPVSIGRPAIGPDGTIYMSALDATLYALNVDGSVKWTFTLGVSPGGDNTYMPGVDRTGGPYNGTIYSDIAGNSIVALDPDGNEKWQLYIDADFDSTPIVGSVGPAVDTIFFGTDEPPNAIFAVNPDGTERWQFNTGDNVDTVPVLSPDGSVVYAVSNDNLLYAVNVSADPLIDGTLKWTFPIDTDPGDINSSPTVNPSDGTIYVGSADNHSAFAINPDGTLKWQFNPGTGRDMRSSPTFAIDPINSIPTVYIGSDDGNLYAINANTGNDLWRFDTGSPVVSSPIVDLDGTIYVGSDNGNVYAINPDGTQKWLFPTGGLVRSSPAIGKAGFIHVGSDDTNFYTISQFADPRNFKLKFPNNKKALLTYQDLDVPLGDLDDPTGNDWLNGDPGVKGPWAVRLEVDRSLVPNSDDNYDYQLSLWIRQCQELDCSDINGTTPPHQRTCL
jgi:outer membrane protein assembly factor BamB